jgi:hypothetical protein
MHNDVIDSLWPDNVVVTVPVRVLRSFMSLSFVAKAQYMPSTDTHSFWMERAGPENVRIISPDAAFQRVSTAFSSPDSIKSPSLE